MKKTIITILKFAISAAILYFLVVWTRSKNPELFQRLVEQPKHWGMMAGAGLITLSAVLISFHRWWLLGRAVGLEFGLSDAVRLGFLGFFFNFFSLGNVGGDLFKAVFIAREQRGRRAVAVATVLVDRILGLYGLMLMCTIAVLIGGLYRSQVLEMRLVSQVALACTAIATTGLGVLLIPGFTTGPVSELMRSVPKIGGSLGRLVDAVHLYVRRLPIVLFAIGEAVCVHLMMALSLYMLAISLPDGSPTLNKFFLIEPASMLVGAIPLPMGSLGAFEGALEFFFQQFAAPNNVPEGKGFVVALAYRLVTFAIACVGAALYVTRRKSVQEAMAEDQREESSAESDPTPEPLAASAR